MDSNVSVQMLYYLMIAGAVGLFLLLPRQRGGGLAKLWLLVAGVALVGLLGTLLGVGG